MRRVEPLGAAGVNGTDRSKTRLDRLSDSLGKERLDGIDFFDQVQLANVIRVCRDSRSLADAGRRLLSVSRGRKASTNDADRLRKYLNRFGI